MSTTTEPAATSAGGGSSTPSPEGDRTSNSRGPGGSPILRALSFRNISAIYIFVVIIIVFGLWTPQTFLTAGVWRSLLDAQALTALAALAALIPLVAGVFNLAIGAEVGFAGILSAFLLAKVGMPMGLQIPVVLACGAFIGLISGLIVTKAKIDSFIATLGMQSILLAAIAWVSNSQQILNLGPVYRYLATTQILGITLPVYILVIVSLITWYVLEKTPVGRRMYAVGYNPDGARLAGVKIERLQIGSLMAGGVIAAIAGVLMTSRINAGDPTVGPSMLLPALSGVFLGSTQFKGGRFNVWGTIIAVYVLAAGVKGLQLVGTPNWINDLFNGLALLVAVGLSRWERTSKRTAAIRRATTFGRKAKAELAAKESAQS